VAGSGASEPSRPPPELTPILLRLGRVEVELETLRRAHALLDGQFYEVLDKLDRRLARSRMQAVRDEGDAERVKEREQRARRPALNLDDLLQKAVENATKEVDE
jgi:hypothetical protein